jgi:hypothetical protein
MASAYALDMAGSIVRIHDESSHPPDFRADVDIVLPHISTTPRSVLVCARIHESAPEAPIVFVVSGNAVELLPNIALAQRTAHRAVAGYVLIDPAIGKPMQDWPDAPVLVITADERVQREASLRNWRVSDDLNLTSAVSAFAAQVLPGE